MSSHDHHDLARLAELAASDPRGHEVRAMVAECTECAEEFRLQVEALGYLGEITTEELSDVERTRLRDGIWSRLQEESEERPAPTTTPTTPLAPRRSWYPKVVGVAAALVMVVGLGYVLTDGAVTGGDDARSPDVAAESADADGGGGLSTAAAEQSVTTETTAASANTTVAAGGDLGTADAEVAEGETAADSTSAALAPTEAGESVRLDEDVIATVSETVDRLRNTASARSTEDLRLTTAEEECIAELGIDRILTVDSITADDTRLTVVSRRGDPDVVVFDPTNCQKIPGIGG